MVYIKGCSNVVTDNLPRLPRTAVVNIVHWEELFELDPHKPEFVLDTKVIVREQQEDLWLTQEIKNSNKLLSQGLMGRVKL